MTKDAPDPAIELDRHLVVLSVDRKGVLSLEENHLPGWMLIGVARWLDSYAEGLMEEEDEESE